MERRTGSVERAIAALDALAERPDGVGVNELARLIGVNASTASRLLATLERGGLVERPPNGGPYRLGLRLLALADGVLARLDVRELARPQLRDLAAATGETATLSVPGAREAVTVDFVAGASSVVSMARVGRPSVAHATSVGKLMLAYAGVPDGLRLPRFTDRTITDRPRLDDELRRIRDAGWAESLAEREPDLHGLAAPVLDRTGALAAIVGVQGPAARLTEERREAVLPHLRETASALSTALGAQLQG